MPNPTGPTSATTKKLIVGLKKKKEKFYLDLARQLQKPARKKGVVNIQKLNKLSGRSTTFAVPGKVLGVGEIEKPVNVYAFSFSREAREKITKAGGKALPLNEILKKEIKARIVI